MVKYAKLIEIMQSKFREKIAFDFQHQRELFFRPKTDTHLSGFYIVHAAIFSLAPERDVRVGKSFECNVKHSVIPSLKNNLSSGDVLRPTMRKNSCLDGKRSHGESENI